ncbi:uncharacterized protein TNCT_674941, partial [Trichonephila clavata]
MTSIEEPGSLVGDPSDQCVEMEEIPTKNLTDEERCSTLSSLETQIQVFDARRDYVIRLMEIDKLNGSPLPETMPQLVSEKENLEDKIKYLEGKTHEILPCPIANCRHHIRYKAFKRPAEPIIRPSILEASISKKSKINDNVFSYPKKPAKSVPVEIGINQVKTKNSFAALNTAETDAEDVTPVPNKIKPIMMRISASYNLILQELHRTYPTAVNTHINDSLPELSSDHNPIQLHFPRTSNFEIPPPQVNTTWSIFTKSLANYENFDLPSANSTGDIDSQVSNLTTEILSAHSNASKPINPTEPPYVQGELKQLLKDRNRARKIWQYTRHPQHKTDLNRLQNIIKRKTYTYRQQAWEDHLTSLDAEDNSLWRTAKAFRKKATPISAIQGPHGIALSDTNKTDLIATSLE